MVLARRPVGVSVPVTGQERGAPLQAYDLGEGPATVNGILSWATKRQRGSPVRMET